MPLLALDTKAALDILKEDDLIDKEFDGFVQAGHLHDGRPRTISASLDLLFWPRPLSASVTTRKMWPNSSFIWSRAKDVRHAAMNDIESAVLQ